MKGQGGPGGLGSRRIRWGVVDQAASSLSNFTLTLLVARSTGARELGVFTLAFAGYLLAMGISRGFVSEPFMLLHTNGHGEAKLGARGGLATTVALAGVASCLAIVLFVLTGNSFALATALGLPVLLAQDFCRYVLFAADEGRKAASLDLVWLVLGLFALSVASFNSASILNLFYLWIFAGSLSCGLGLFFLGVLPSLSDGRQFWATNRGVGLRFVGEFLSSTGAAQLSLYIVGMIGGLGVLGQLRVAQLGLGPLQVIVMGWGIVAIPEATSLFARDPDLLISRIYRVAGAFALLAGLYGAAVYFAPSDFLSAIFGPVWLSARPLIPALAVGLAGSAMTITGSSAARAQGLISEGLKVRIVGSVLLLGLSVLGVGLAEAKGAAWGVGVGAVVTGVLFLGLAHGGSRLRDAGGRVRDSTY